MALTITTVTRDGGPNCNHVTVTYNHEGTVRTMKTSFPEIDAMFADMPALEQLRLLVILWAKYRRAQSRAIESVVIA